MGLLIPRRDFVIYIEFPGLVGAYMFFEKFHSKKNESTSAFLQQEATAFLQDVGM